MHVGVIKVSLRGLDYLAVLAFEGFVILRLQMVSKAPAIAIMRRRDILKVFVISFIKVY